MRFYTEIKEGFHRAARSIAEFEGQREKRGGEVIINDEALNEANYQRQPFTMKCRHQKET
ncbi:hypothetical protein DIT68_11915 [Brumimicrobium oceani]|uniref:Uncharacterized protein n=1 Tax=Brumimicrobium oceani TaxID=2100725 RepID=A0A2U2XAM4_9FLAO|nr:hypothetical protein DIT68_11915 [Brumimicrobium oceani]